MTLPLRRDKIIDLKKYIAKMQRYLWPADDADKADSRGFLIIYFLIRVNPCNPWIKVF